MAQRIVAMIHVPDVRATVDWYTSIGFKLRGQNEEDGELNWASLTLGEGEIMLQSSGKASGARRREFDLYIWVDDVDDLARRIRDRVEVVVDLNDTFYGMREFIIRDINRFWITFGQPIEK
jgi:uncharacterized glyoxalase superfamily protein PhnB